MIDRLRELLRAATPETKGRWVYRRCDFGQGPVDDYSYVEWGDHVEGYGTAALSVPMARYLAALSPKAVAELLDAHDRMAGALAEIDRPSRRNDERSLPNRRPFPSPRHPEGGEPRMSAETIENADLTPAQALGVALSVAAPRVTMAEAQEKAPAALADLEAMGYALTPLVPEVPPREDGLREAVEAQITGLLSISEPLSPIERGNLGAYQDVLNLIDRLAATRTPEPPDSGPCGVPGTDGHGFARTCTDVRGHGGLHSASDSPGTPTGAATWRWPEPPDSGDGAAGIDAETIHRWLMEDDLLPDCSGTHLMGYGTCQRLAARLRSGSPAPEGGE